jgi:hypothetical protein
MYLNTPTRVSTTAWLTKLTHEITQVWTLNLNRWRLHNDLRKKHYSQLQIVDAGKCRP